MIGGPVLSAVCLDRGHWSAAPVGLGAKYAKSECRSRVAKLTGCCPGAGGTPGEAPKHGG